MKKVGGLLIAGLMLSMFMVHFASAYSVAQRVDSTINFFTPIIKPLLGDVSNIVGYTEGDVLFAKLLIFILVMLIAKAGLEKVEAFRTQRGIKWAISIIIPLLGVRFLTFGQILAIIFPSQTLAIALSAGIPFVLYFFLTKDLTTTVRKVGWIFFIVIFLGVYISRADDLANVAFAEDIYLFTIVASFLVLIFDGTIQRFLLKRDIEKAGAESVQEEVRYLKRQIYQIREDFKNGLVSQAEMDDNIRRYTEMMVALKGTI